MTDTNTLPPIAQAPDGIANETKAAAAAQYKSAGYDDAALAAAGYGTAPAAPPVVNPNMQATVPPGSNVAVMGQSANGISQSQAISAARNLVNHGVDPATVAKAAAAHGLEPKDFMTDPPSAEAIAAAKRDAEVDAGYAPPAKDDTYHLQFPREFAEASDTAELVQLGKDFENGFKHAGVPTALAQPLLDSFMQTGELYADATPAAAEMRWKEEQARFNSISRNPTEDNRLAVRGFEALPRSLQETLAGTHAVHSAAARFQLAALGRALEYRAARKGGSK